MRIIIKNKNGYYMIYKKWESGYETPFSLRKFKNLVECLENAKGVAQDDKVEIIYE